MAIPTNLQDRFRGCLLGLAAGDALGTTLEFQRPGTFQPISDMVGGGPFRLPVGAWTDDTSMALCLGTSLLYAGGMDYRDQMNRYCNWMEHGYLSSTGTCFDIGNTVSDALHAYQRTGEPFSGSTDPFSAGNGSLMRLAPVPMFYAASPETAIRMAAESSRTTHGARAAVDACRLYAGLIVGALQGASKEEFLSPAYRPTGQPWSEAELDPGIWQVSQGSYKTAQPPAIAGTGYVVKSMEAALWAFHQSSDFREGALLAANLGNDADTTAAIYGQLAGAYYGMSGIPEVWLIKLCMMTEIRTMADELLAAAQL